MGFMRLGTRVAVINEQNEILLSKRGDFGTWSLPGGRVDSGELIQDTAVREVREETGLEVEIVRPVGLYFQQGRSRTDILFRAKPIAGELFKSTDETLDNRFFAPDALPEIPFGTFYIDHAYTNQAYLYTIESSAWELFKLDLQLRWRWIQNLISGRPEPKFPKFTVRAVGIAEQNGELLLQNGELPTIVSDGTDSLWADLTKMLKLNPEPNWQCLGLWQETKTDTLEFVFAQQQLDKHPNTFPENLPEYQKNYLSKLSEKTVWFISES